MQVTDCYWLSTAAGVGLQAFAGWVLQHGSLFNADRPGFSQLHARAAELMQDPRVDTNPAYWPTVHRLVLLGQVELAGSLLARHPVMEASTQPGTADMVRLDRHIFCFV
jgi:hypothetical protein